MTCQICERHNIGDRFRVKYLGICKCGDRFEYPIGANKYMLFEYTDDKVCDGYIQHVLIGRKRTCPKCGNSTNGFWVLCDGTPAPSLFLVSKINAEREAQ